MYAFLESLRTNSQINQEIFLGVLKENLFNGKSVADISKETGMKISRIRDRRVRGFRILFFYYIKNASEWRSAFQLAADKDKNLYELQGEEKRRNDAKRLQEEEKQYREWLASLAPLVKADIFSYTMMSDKERVDFWHGRTMPPYFKLVRVAPDVFGLTIPAAYYHSAVHPNHEVTHQWVSGLLQNLGVLPEDMTRLHGNSGAYTRVAHEIAIKLDVPWKDKNDGYDGASPLEIQIPDPVFHRVIPY